MESSRDMNTVVGTGTSGNRSAARAKAANAPPLRRESEGRQCATMSPGACSSALRWYIQRTESPLYSGLVGRAPATLEKRIPINNSYQ